MSARQSFANFQMTVFGKVFSHWRNVVDFRGLRFFIGWFSV
jgi:hypothetical protein